MTLDVIAIDGPSYVGKSTIARELGRLTGYQFINTGHMYRSIARLCVESAVDPSDTAGVLAVAEKTRFDFRSTDRGSRTYVNGADWTDELQSPEIIRYASRIAAIAPLREILTRRQREIALQKKVIMEGRDIGTEVFPQARYKFFITASAEIRAKRMLKTLSEAEKKRYPGPEDLLRAIAALDEADQNRPIAPLRQAPDAIVYDNSASPTETQDADFLRTYLKDL